MQTNLNVSTENKNNNQIIQEETYEPKLRFSNFDEYWIKVNLNKYLSFKNGFNGSRENYGKGMKFINVLDILENNYLTYDNIIDSVNVDDKTIQNYLVEYGDILFQRSSENREEVGTSNVYLDNKPCIFGGFVIRGKKIREYNPFFFKELLNTSKVRNEISSWSGGSTRFNVGQDTLNKISIILPKIEEQNKIANFLSCIDKKIELMQKKHKSIEIFKKEFFNNYISNLKENEECQKIRLNGIISISNLKNKNDEDLPVLSINNKLGFISQEEQFEDRIVASSDTKNYKIVEIGDFAYNPARINVGSIARLKTFKKGIISPMYIVFRIDDSIINPIFFENYINSNYFKLEVLKRLEGSVRLVLSGDSLKNIEIFIPSLTEQKKIGKFLNLLSIEINNSQITLNNLKKFKKGLLQQMFV